MNSNAFHNVANILSLALAVTTAVLIWSGCIQTPVGTFDCSNSWINPSYTALAIAGLQAMKTGVNVIRDGLGGLFKPQPPVQK